MEFIKKGEYILSLKIADETVYVIYRNGAPYDNRGRKLVYTSKGAANKVITEDSQKKARIEYSGDWYELNSAVREALTEIVRNEFTIVEYGPKENRNANTNG